MTKKSRILPWLALLTAVTFVARGTEAEETRERADREERELFVIEGARLFDGERALDPTPVVIQGGRIVAVGAGFAIPEDAPRVDGTGATLLPGFVDAHVHAYGDAPQRALVFGVTTELDMFTSPELARAMRTEQEDDGAPHRADLFSAGYLATAPRGHGTQFGLPVPTLTSPNEAAAWVAARAEEGSDYVKIISEDGSTFGRKIPPLDRATIEALIEAAHDRDLLAVVHATSLERATWALEDGADGLAHVFRDSPAPEAFVERAKESGIFVIPTLTVTESLGGTASGAGLAEDPRVARYLRPEEAANLRTSRPGQPGVEPMGSILATVGRLHEAGVPILAGTDAPNPGTAHGASIHRELELLVAAGLTPVEALTAATSAAADAFGLEDRGRIAVGKRADLVLVDGDPTKSIESTRALRAVWKGGRRLERSPVESEESAPSLGIQLPESGVLSTFDDGLSSTFGLGWQVSTDQMRGGASTAVIELVAPGASDTSGALGIVAEVRPGPSPWAGAIFFPGSQPMAPVDLSEYRGLELWVRGEPGEYRLLGFATSLGGMPTEKRFAVTAEWTRIEVPFAALDGLDPRGLTAIFVGSGPETGTFRLEVDEVRLLR